MIRVRAPNIQQSIERQMKISLHLFQSILDCLQQQKIINRWPFVLAISIYSDVYLVAICEYLMFTFILLFEK